MHECVIVRMSEHCQRISVCVGVSVYLLLTCLLYHSLILTYISFTGCRLDAPVLIFFARDYILPHTHKRQLWCVCGCVCVCVCVWLLARLLSLTYSSLTSLS